MCRKLDRGRSVVANRPDDPDQRAEFFDRPPHDGASASSDTDAVFPGKMARLPN